ncbi:MAG: hypothetical protein ACTSQG_00100 [Promethearchaeota archaeon]
MSLIWLIFWLFNDLPPLHNEGMTNWGIALIICIVLDISLN